MIISQLRKARELLQLETADVERSLKLGDGQVKGWESGKAKPTLSELEQLAKFYGRDITYFLKETPQYPTQIQFRSNKKNAFKDLHIEARQTIAKFDELCRFAIELEEVTGKKLQVNIHYSNETNPKLVAQKYRREFNLGEKPTKNLKGLLENLGIRIFELPDSSKSFSGFSLWHREYGPCILVNYKDTTAGRKNFTLAHELYHLTTYRASPLLCDIESERESGTDKIEIYANRFAIELLLPSDSVKRDFEQHNLSKEPSLRELGNMAGRWGVSVQAIGYRLEELFCIKQGRTNKLLASAELPHPRRGKRPPYERKLGEHFVSLAFEAYKGESISIGRLAQFLGLDVGKAIDDFHRRRA